MAKTVIDEELELEKSKKSLDEFVNYLKTLSLEKIYSDPSTETLCFVYNNCEQDNSSQALEMSRVKIRLKHSKTYMNLVKEALYYQGERKLHLCFQREDFIKEHKEALKHKVFDSFLQYIKDGKKAVKVIKAEDPESAATRKLFSDKNVVKQLAAQLGIPFLDDDDKD